MNRIDELSGYYVALLRCISLVHQLNHWRTSGNDFYGNHLLFERIYKSSADNADLAAEKIIGIFGLDAVDPHVQAQIIGKILDKYSVGDPLDTSLTIEKKMITFSQTFYDVVKKENKMSLGLDDMIMSIASDREGAVYLLQQAKGGKPETISSGDEKIAARISLLKRIKNAQDARDVERKLLGELTALVVSEIPGTYQSGDIMVSVDAMSKKIEGKVKTKQVVPPHKKLSIEKAFIEFVHNLVPNGEKDFTADIIFALVNS